jgi:hypothetical protein
MLVARIARGVALALFMFMASKSTALAQSDYSEFKQQTRRALASLANALARDNLFPIAIPEGQTPGDAYSFSNYWVRESRAKDCFKELKPSIYPWPTIALTGISETSADGKLSLLSLLHLNASDKTTASVAVSYVDVQSKTVTRQELLRAFRRADCSYLEPALEAKIVSASTWGMVNKQVTERPMIVLHRVVEARRRIVISLLDGGEGGLKIENPKDLIKALGLENDPRARFVDGSLAAEFKATRKRAVVIEDKQRVPVAFTPVSLPSVRVAPLLSGQPGPPKAVEWIPIDAENGAMNALLPDWEAELMDNP